MKYSEKLLDNLYLIDGHDLSLKERTGTYVLREKELTLIETSASPSVPYIIKGLDELNISLEDVKYIIVTHIHLDHSGGVGLLLEKCPNATVVVHPKGKRHLVDPSRLIESARMVYGEKFDTLFDPILPVPEDRVIIKEDKETLTIGDDCTLTFYNTPGHSFHHFSIYHPKVNGMFTGDTCGMFYTGFLQSGVEVYLPSTSPNQFTPDKMVESIRRFKEMNLDYIFFGHYGMSSKPDEVYEQVTYWIDEFVKIGEQGFERGETFEERTKHTTERLFERIKAHLMEKGIGEDHPTFDILKADFEINAQGIIDYLQKQKATNS